MAEMKVAVGKIECCFWACSPEFLKLPPSAAFAGSPRFCWHPASERV